MWPPTSLRYCFAHSAREARLALLLSRKRVKNLPTGGKAWRDHHRGLVLQRLGWSLTRHDYDAVVMGVLEPILVLSVMAVIAFLVRLFWVVPSVMTLN